MMLNESNYESVSLKEYAEKAYLNYSMYVILDRALPHIVDGLKPVQRRIVYAMSELRLKSGAKYKKSARTIGDVIGKFHPHGDSAVYEAMVIMAQPFAYRYPLIDGQGNWGSADDPKSFAAMRYTEARLTPYANLLLEELGMGATQWLTNFDGTMDEPQVLPSQVPNVLLNGTTGIAVGMATDIPPHNLKEVLAGTIAMLDNPKITLEELLEYIKAPDFAGEAKITSSREDILSMYETGKGSIKLQANWEIEDGNIVVTALPAQTSGAKVLEQIASQLNSKKLTLITDLRDESDHENPTRLLLIPRSNRVDAEAIMGHLFATTDLERNIRVNMNMIGTNGLPTVKGLVGILQEWLESRIELVRLRTENRLQKVMERLHLLNGLLIALLNIDEVIHIIRTEDHPKQELIKRFQLTEIQANYVLDTRLRQLARLEEIQITEEQKKLTQEKEALELLLSSKSRIKMTIKKELQAIMKEYGDERRSILNATSIESKAFTAEDLITNEPVTIVLSSKGWVRSAKGHDIDPVQLNYKAGDQYLTHVKGRNHHHVAFLDTTGRSYSQPAHTLPTARGQGEPLTGRYSPVAGSEFCTIATGSEEQYFLLAADNGYGYICSFKDMLASKKAGKAQINLTPNSRVITPKPVTDLQTDLIVAVTNLGRMLVFPASILPCLAKGKGNKIISINTQKFNAGEERMQDCLLLPKDHILKVVCGKQYLRFKEGDWKVYQGERGRRGLMLPRGYQRVDSLEYEEKN